MDGIAQVGSVNFAQDDVWFSRLDRQGMRSAQRERVLTVDGAVRRRVEE